jgi:hypothetical protein
MFQPHKKWEKVNLKIKITINRGWQNGKNTKKGWIGYDIKDYFNA